MHNFNSQEGYSKPIPRIKIVPEGLPIQQSGHKNIQSRAIQFNREDFLSYLAFIDENWISTHPQNTLIVKGTIHLLQGLLAKRLDDNWNNSPTKSLIAHLSFLKIQEEFGYILQNKDEDLIYDTASHIEQIQGHLSTLLEIFSPFNTSDFSLIYANLLSWIPKQLKPMTSYGIHSSGMTSLAGIFKAVETTLEHAPCVLYGENTYFENVIAADMLSSVCSIDAATGKDWENVDLILSQFNPVLRRIDYEVTRYKVEEIAKNLHLALGAKRVKPLTLALDCTLDFIHSSKVSKLLAEFQDAINEGKLNIICYRSGLKFDLFGMDNYCGSPFYMIHNHDAKWAAFDSVLNAPVLQTDRLSFNWFCLAYQNAAPQLEQYREQIFGNTRAFLDKIPESLTREENLHYRVVPVDPDAEAAFVDIKILGPLHTLRGGLIAGFLTLKCMEEKHPLFYRPSIGFYHPNLSLLFSENCSTIRLTLGLDPKQVDVLVACFKTIDTLN